MNCDSCDKRMTELKEGGHTCHNKICSSYDCVYCACGNKAIEEIDVCVECK